MSVVRANTDIQTYNMIALLHHYAEFQHLLSMPTPSVTEVSHPIKCSSHYNL